MEPGTIIGGKLRVERVLGRGGMGVVVVATHLGLHQQVAVKVLQDELATDPSIVERFLREGQACAKLRSEHVCRVYDVGTLASGAPYLVMELLVGDDLAAVIKDRPLTIDETVDAVTQACEAIGEAHALGIVHRDLKPANLFVGRRVDGSRMVKVLDFGIAKIQNETLKLTQTASMMGSPAYMSPEQLRSARDVDARTDIWALGVILYQCVSGQLPFPASTITELVAMVLAEPPQPLRIEPRFDAIVMRCLEKDRERRYPTVRALVDDLLGLRGAGASPPVARSMNSQTAPVVPRARPAAAPASPASPAVPTVRNAPTTPDSPPTQYPSHAPQTRDSPYPSHAGHTPQTRDSPYPSHATHAGHAAHSSQSPYAPTTPDAPSTHYPSHAAHAPQTRDSPYPSHAAHAPQTRDSPYPSHGAYAPTTPDVADSSYPPHAAQTPQTPGSPYAAHTPHTPFAANQPHAAHASFGHSLAAATVPEISSANGTRRFLVGLGVVVACAALIGVGTRLAGSGSGSGPKDDKPAGGGSATDHSLKGVFAKAMFDHRCDDALAAANAIGRPEILEQARHCQPRKVSTKVYPETLEGANDANMDGEHARSFEIAEGLLKRDPDSAPLLQLAGLLACELRKPDEARRYVPRIVPVDMRDFIKEQCRVFGITFP